MKEEMKWITIWILTNMVMATLSLIYFYLNHELTMYGALTVSLCLLSIILPYIVWKYHQIMFVERNNIIIQILRD